LRLYQECRKAVPNLGKVGHLIQECFKNSQSAGNINEAFTYCRKGVKVTTLHLACHRGILEIVDMLLTHSANVTVGNTSIAVDVNVKDSADDTPLHTTCQEQHLAVVRKLIEHPDVDVNARNHIEQTSLHFVRNEPILQELLSHPHVNIMAVDCKGEIPLHTACRRDDCRGLELLLNYQPEKYELLQLNRLTVSMFTPLHITCYNSQNDEAVRVILRHGKKIMNINA
jgi:ankyrin repeat protein